MRKAIDILVKKQNYLIGLAIFLALSAVSITVSKGQTSLNFSNYPILMIGLVLASIRLVLIYISIDQMKIEKLSSEIKSIPEKAKFEQTNRKEMKSNSLYIATFLILLICSFTFDSHRVHWFWIDMIQIPIILLAISFVLIMFQQHNRREDISD